MSLESCIESAKQFVCPMTLMLDNPKKCIANKCVKWCYYKEIQHVEFSGPRGMTNFFPGRKESWCCGLGS